MPANPRRRRRQRVVESSDSEGPAVSLDTSHGDTSKMQPDGHISTDVGSETEAQSQTPKRRKLEAQPVPQVLGK